jgi:hypothetical protein
MALLGQAALAMWWDMAPEVRFEFEDWHSHEHFPERLSVPGFQRATRWTSSTGGEGIFVMYELDAHATLSSVAYLQHLNTPTPWSTRMMPHHRHMVRSQCHVLASFGGSVARHAFTVRLSPKAGCADALQAALKSLGQSLVMRPGIAGLHLLKHQSPAIAQTTEQKMRGGDQVADWVLVVCGYELQALEALAKDALSDASLQHMGAEPASFSALYGLSHSAVPTDN